MWDKEKKIIENIRKNKNSVLVVLLAGVLLLVLAMPTNTSTQISQTDTQSESSQEELEKRLERILRNTEGVGNVKVMITQSEESVGLTDNGQSEVMGVVVVAEGATNGVTCKKIQDIVLALFSIDAHKIEIVKMKAD